ncbi:TRAP transporter small permease subunit [Roseibium limicola]|uniref:TRAP transporter small permease protein n=1 Tax=Roseibium limicola TaxID=2816037 RepID=A0A939ERL2_9HYPH|nr:TRAP transporter small permease [Roseibium limicola]MBO0347441.1 TRAP transporter small permease [Roseibium limicola]
MSMFDRIWRGYGTFLKACGYVAGYTTFAMMLLVIANAVSRFIFNAPVSGAFELTESMLTVLIFLSLALTQYEGGHIRVVLLTQRMPNGLQKAARFTALALGAIFFAWCTNAAWGYAMKSFAINEQQWGTVRYPLYPIKFVVFFGLMLLAIQFVLGSLRVLIKTEEHEELTSE